MAGPRSLDAPAPWDEEARFVADWVLDRTQPGYGPRGGLTILDGEVPELHDSAAVLRDLPSTHPGLLPYRRLVTGVHRAVGDQGALALLLAAGIVHHAGRAMDDGVPRAAVVEGLELAGRQLRAWLPAHATAVDAVQALEATDPASWAPHVIPGLRRMVHDGRIDLDQVDIRNEPGPVWSDGLRLELHGVERPCVDARVLMLQEGPRRRPRTDAVLRAPGHDAEAAIDRAWLDRLDRLGVDVLVVAGRLEALRGRVATRIRVADDVPRDLRQRIEVATGARPVGRLEEATASELGRGDLSRAPRRLGDWILQGPGPGTTFSIGAHGSFLDGLWHDRAERFLRTAGVVLDDPRALPGGGRWQREAARALERMADHAPGKASFGVRVVVQALHDIVRSLLVNVGRDPLDGGYLDEVHDCAPAVEAAVDAALQVARTLLRVDARHNKRESRGVELRGGTGKAGSPKGMPGDIPPLM